MRGDIDGLYLLHFDWVSLSKFPGTGDASFGVVGKVEVGAVELDDLFFFTAIFALACFFLGSFHDLGSFSWVELFRIEFPGKRCLAME